MSEYICSYIACTLYIQYYKIFILQLNNQFRRKDSHINVWKLIEHSLNASFKGLSTFYTFDPQIPVCCHFRKRIFKASQKSSFNKNGQAFQIIAFKNVDDLANVCCEWAEMELRLKFVSNYNLFSTFHLTNLPSFQQLNPIPISNPLFKLLWGSN